MGLVLLAVPRLSDGPRESVLNWEVGQRKKESRAWLRLGGSGSHVLASRGLGSCPSGITYPEERGRGARKACQVEEALADVCPRSRLSVNRSGVRSRNGSF